jgi:hypothetical protein
MLLGRVVTNTIAGGIADPAVFARQPEVRNCASCNLCFFNNKKTG